MAEPTPAAHVESVDMVTAVGGCVAQTAISFRAGLNGYVAGSLTNRRGAPMTLSPVPDAVLPALKPEVKALGNVVPHVGRLLRLLDAAWPASVREGGDGPIAVYLSVPDGCATPAFLNMAATQVGVPFAMPPSSTLAAGRAGGFRLLADAVEQLSSGAFERVVWAGVDSYLERPRLMALDQNDRVLAPGIPDGFCPGEAAAVITLRAPKPTGGGLAAVFRAGVSEEPGVRGSKEVYRGDGLASAVRDAIQAAATSGVQRVLSSMNGESYWAKEWGTTYLRNRASFADAVGVEYPAASLGDVGAASAPVFVGLAAHGTASGWDRGPILTYCSSDEGLRGAACIAPVG